MECKEENSKFALYPCMTQLRLSSGTDLKLLLSDIRGRFTSQELKILQERFLKSDLNALDAFNALSRLLDTCKEPRLVFDLIHCFQRFWHSLPEETKCGEHCESRKIVERVDVQVKASYTSIADFLFADTDTPAIIDGQKHDRVLSHRAIHEFVRGFDLGLPVRDNGKPRVVVALPNGSMMGLACIAVATYYTLVPMAPSVGAEQFRADVERVKPAGIIALAADVQKLKLEDPTWTHAARISVFVAKPRDGMTFDMELLASQSEHYCRHEFSIATRNSNTADDIAMMLFTSGTSGTKKLVPISTHSMIAGAAFVIDSWGLEPSDCCLNMMPLHHM